MFIEAWWIHGSCMVMLLERLVREFIIFGLYLTMISIVIVSYYVGVRWCKNRMLNAIIASRCLMAILGCGVPLV
jgi:hypothetical protein